MSAYGSSTCSATPVSYTKVNGAQGPQGPAGADGSDANVVQSTLQYMFWAPLQNAIPNVGTEFSISIGTTQLNGYAVNSFLVLVVPVDTNSNGYQDSNTWCIGQITSLSGSLATVAVRTVVFTEAATQLTCTTTSVGNSSTQTIPKANFNRTPIVGEYFTTILRYTSNNSYYYCILRVQTVGTSTITCSVIKNTIIECLQSTLQAVRRITVNASHVIIGTVILEKSNFNRLPTEGEYVLAPVTDISGDYYIALLECTIVNNDETTSEYKVVSLSKEAGNKKYRVRVVIYAYSGAQGVTASFSYISNVSMDSSSSSSPTAKFSRLCSDFYNYGSISSRSNNNTPASGCLISVSGNYPVAYVRMQSRTTLEVIAAVTVGGSPTTLYSVTSENISTCDFYYDEL